MPTVVRLGADRYSAFDLDPAGLLDDLPEPVAYFDAANRLSFCNRKFRETFPIIIESEFIRRYGLTDDEDPSSRIPWKDPGKGLVRKSRPFPPTRSSLTVEARKMPNGGTLLVFHAPSAADAVAKLKRKIARQGKALRAALSARRAAVTAARARGDFLTATSHELRTPLNAILGFSEILQREMFGPLANERYREYVDIIHDSGNHLLNLINDLLDLSKLDAGKLEMHFESVELLKVIIDCVRGVNNQAANSHVGISINLHDDIRYLRSDDKRLRQMLLNLLSNAIKFTPEGGEIYVSAFRRGESVAIEVSDTGIGISPDNISKVLEPFGQIDNALGRKHQGTGLGLPLTKELAELHGGSLQIESAQDVGTTVTILLPSEDQIAHKPRRPAVPASLQMICD